MRQFGTPLESEGATIQDPPAMKPDKGRAARLNAIATRMMIEGNVERYLHALRLIFMLRHRHAALA